MPDSFQVVREFVMIAHCEMRILRWALMARALAALLFGTASSV